MSQHHKFIYGFIPKFYQNCDSLDKYREYVDDEATVEEYQEYESVVLRLILRFGQLLPSYPFCCGRK